MSTFLAVLGCAGTVVLWGLLCWVRRQYGLETAAMSQRIKYQKAYTDLLCDERNVNREKIVDLEAGVARRDETISRLIARIEGLTGSYDATCRELDARNCELLAMRNKAKEIFATSFASNSAGDSDQPQKPLCDN